MAIKNETTTKRMGFGATTKAGGKTSNLSTSKKPAGTTSKYPCLIYFRGSRTAKIGTL